ncbi:flippase [Bacillus sp. PS06]|uniref:flippase n=1 Tax=Bacillus sp. PS06 TaxID=2764176 RepID=UPI00177EDD97|nr:flippase [Bacillus sp. PS06]MBD8069404.1 flippase [Bacillus sp. PS06]
MTQKKRLVSNFISLAILQGTNYILPLITLPYLVRILGPGNYGLIAFAQAFIHYFLLLTDYGFNLTATKQISINRDNQKKVSEILSNVLFIKLLLMISSFTLLCILVFSIDKFKEYWPIYLLSFGMVLGNVLFPIWFFQGMEKMKYISILNIIAKLISTVSIFIFVNSKSDIYFVPLLNSIGFVIVGLVSLFLIYKHFDIRFEKPKVELLKIQLIEGWYVFISTISVSIYTVSSTFILGIFTNNTVVGYYASGEKIVKAVQGLIQPVSQTVYPYINKLVSESRVKTLIFIRKLFVLVGSFTFVMSLFLFIFAEKLVNLVLGNDFEPSVIVVKILAFLPFIVGLSNVLGIQTMLTFNYKKAFSRIIIISGVINIIIAITIVPMYEHIGTAISVTIVESIITIMMFIYLQNKGIKILEVKNV